MNLILPVFALVLFILAAVISGRGNLPATLIAAGLACWVASQILF